MAAPTLDGRVICASKWAYAISEPGPVGALEPYFSGCGLQGQIVGFATGSSRIDAALVGTGPDGVVLASRPCGMALNCVGSARRSDCGSYADIPSIG